MPDACDRHRRGRGNRLACSHELASASSVMCPSAPLASMLARGHLGISFYAACCNDSCSTLQSSPQRAAISPTAYRNLLRSIQQSSTQHTAIFTQRTAILHIAYSDSSHSIPQFSTQRTEILHIAYRNLPQSIPQSSTQRTVILRIACCNPPRSIQQFSPPLIEISVCSLLMAIQSLLMAIQRLLMCIQRLQTEILATILIHFFRVLG